MPGWLPPHYVRYNWADFGPEQVVGIIKDHVLRNGGRLTPATALKRAQLFKEDEDYKHARRSIAYDPGMQAIHDQVAEMYALIKTRCEEIFGQGYMHIGCEYVLQFGHREQLCTMTDGRVGVTVNWYAPYIGTLDSSGLWIREFAGALILPSEFGRKMYMDDPERIRESRYKPDLSRTRELGWSGERSDDFKPTAKLAEDVLIRFIELADSRAGKRH